MTKGSRWTSERVKTGTNSFDTRLGRIGQASSAWLVFRPHGDRSIQNIGAYGQELADTALKVRIYDAKTQEFRELSAKDCAFAYRDSGSSTRILR